MMSFMNRNKKRFIYIITGLVIISFLASIVAFAFI